MFKNRGFSILSASTLIVFALSALFTVPALAAAGTPPPAPSSPATQTRLRKVPQGTAVAVVDQNGNLQPLGSRAAAKILADGDPIWCPKGVHPKPGVNGCTSSYPNLDALVSALGSVTPADGVIWIKKGVDTSSADISIAASTLPGLANYSLKLQGGWTGTAAGKVSGRSVFSSPIYVINWNNDVTVQDITVAHDGGASGLGIVTTGNVHVKHFTSDSNVAFGAALYSTNGTITVENSAFTNDAFTGLLANAYGDITLSNVMIHGNQNTGADLANNSGTGAISITTSVFNGNTADGLDAVSNGAITLNNVTADANAGDGAHVRTSGAISVSSSRFNNNTAGDGAHLDNCGWDGSICTDAGSSLVSVVKSSFNGNTAGPGLAVDSKGAITLTNVTANANGEEGAFLENDFTGTSPISVIASKFNNNLGSDGGAGLDPHANGTITITKVTAKGNILNGVDASSLGNIVVNCGNLSQNGLFGIAATLSGGTLTLNHVMLVGNTSGPYSLSGPGTVVSNPTCP